MRIDAALADGTLVHPLHGEPNSVDLFRAVAQLAGGRSIEANEGSRLLSDAIGHHDHYLFVIVDGLGLSLRSAFPAGGFFDTTLSRTLHCVFPSTTATALASLATTSWPAQHGLTGWFTCFPEHRRVFAPLLFVERSTRIPVEELGFGMEDLVAGEPQLGSFFRTVRSVLPQEISDGAFAIWSRSGTPIAAYRSFDHAVQLIRRAYRSLAGPTYTYLYILTVDKLSHAHGTDSAEVAAEVARVDRMLSLIRENAPDSVRMVVTADHGLVDVPEEHRFTIRENDTLARHLVTGPTGESTTPVFHVKPRSQEAFQRDFASSDAASAFELCRPDDLAGRGLYGPAPLSRAMRLHLGDFVGIAVRPAVLEYAASGQKPVLHTGVHGGLRPGEMRVPLFLA